MTKQKAQHMTIRAFSPEERMASIRRSHINRGMIDIESLPDSHAMKKEIDNGKDQKETEAVKAS
tara:strand:+ start:364 stop:555 length:192 start_codon:yes stop_codon:yes gene_type:complete